MLIPVSRPGDAASNVVLTVRSENLRSHAGQISLPGGSIESGDADLAAAALREAEEEIGLPREQVKVIGELGP
ncbi:MAG: NUDIX domain-containing protein, partial [Gammaproteobacteria bacterium]|nr:NUDIX domain-containing protein [Gammaproteobacteria bacterium]